MDENKGITLIALVIMIIVLLILATVSMVALTGENSLLVKAIEASESTQIKSYQEQLAIIWQGVKLEKIEEEHVYYNLLEQAQNKIEKDSNFEGAEVEITDNILRLTTKEGYIFYIIDGEIKYMGKEKEEKGEIGVSMTVSELKNKKVTFTATTSNSQNRKMTYIFYVEGKEVARETTYATMFDYEYTTTFGKKEVYAEVKYEGEKTSQSEKRIIEDNSISSKAELETFRDNVNRGNTYEGKIIELTNSIDLKGSASNNWIPIRDFAGEFRGNNKMIKGVYINKTQDNVGFFQYVTKAGSVKNVILENVTIIGSGSVGGIVGVINSTGEIENCTVSGYVQGHSQVGGIAGYAYENKAIISGCKVYANVTGEIATGGIVGKNYRRIQNCGMYGNTVSNVASNTVSLVGGIVGELNEGYVFSCVNKGNVTGQSYVGGIVGDIRSGTYVNYCYNIGNVQANGNVSRNISLWWDCRGSLWEYLSLLFKGNYPRLL